MGYFAIDTAAYPNYTLGIFNKKPAVPTVATWAKPPNSPIGRAQAAAAATGGAFDINPQPQAGQGPYGAVPGPIAYPTTPYQEASRIYPGFAGLTSGAGDVIASEIRGDFSPQTEAALWDIANRYGVASGMGGPAQSGLWSNRFMGNVAGAIEARQRQGVQDYNAMLANLSRMGVDPALAAEIAARNATMAAAPNPAEAAAALEAAYRNAARAGSRAGYSPAQGTGFYQPPYAPTPTARGPAAGTMSSAFTPPPATRGGTMGYETDPYGAIDPFSESYGLDYLTYGLDPFNYFGGETQGTWYPNENMSFVPGPEMDLFDEGFSYGGEDFASPENDFYDPYADLDQLMYGE